MKHTGETTRVSVDLPNALEAKIALLSRNERRSRQAQIVYMLERSFEPAKPQGEKPETEKPEEAKR